MLIANPSPDVYGSDLQMLESVSALDAAGGRVVVALPDDGPLVGRLRERGAEVQFISFPVLRRANQSTTGLPHHAGPGGRRGAADPASSEALRPSAIYVNTVTLPWWLLVARLTRTPTICHLHEAENTDGGWSGGR